MREGSHLGVGIEACLARRATGVNKVLEGSGNFGYNAANDTHGDMVEMGVLDPTKVTRYALQNAASVAGLMLTTDATAVEAPKEEKAAAPAIPDMDY